MEEEKKEAVVEEQKTPETSPVSQVNVSEMNEEEVQLEKADAKYDADYQENAKKAFKRAEESDFKHKQTSIGIHREDISISLNGRDIATFGSQGENRIAALALKLSPYFLIEDKDKKPIIVLDDVMSELDQANQERLIKFLRKFEQVFITGTKLDIPDCNHLEIKSQTKEVF